MKITRENLEVNIAELKPYEKNARTHSDKQIKQLVESIKEFGFTNPILIDEDNGVIAGHGRLAAAIKLGSKKLPAVKLCGLTAAQKRALVIADNKLAEKLCPRLSENEILLAEVSIGTSTLPGLETLNVKATFLPRFTTFGSKEKLL